MQLFRHILTIVVCALCLVGCATESFNAYQHASMIMTITTSDEYNYAKDYILAHTSESLQTDIDVMLDGDIIDVGYSIIEKGRYIEETDSVVKIILEHEVNSNSGHYNQVTYFEYNDNVLQYYKTYRTLIDEFI